MIPDWRVRAARTLRKPLVVALAVGLTFGAWPKHGTAQELASALGFAGGLFAGAYMTTGAYVLKSRATGWVLHSASDLVAPRPEALPLVVMPIAGAVLGYRSPEKLSAAATWGTVGLVGGGLAGAAMGELVWGNSEGRWAGGTIGSALGLAVGAIAGAIGGGSDEEERPAGQAASYLTFSIPIGGRQ